MHFVAPERDSDCLKNHLAFRRHSIASENSHPVSPAADPGQVGRHELALGKKSLSLLRADRVAHFMHSRLE